LISVITSTASAQTTSPKTKWTLEECLTYATENNISVKQAELSKRISKNTYMQSKLNLLPTVSANASYSFNFGYSVDPTTYTYQKSNSQSFSPNLQGNLILFSGFQQINTIKKDQYDLQSTNYDFANTINNTALNVTNLFLQAVLNKELVKAAEKQVDISQSQLDVQRARIRAGTMAEASIYDFEAQLARDQATLTTQRNSESIALLTLQIALQLPDEQPFDVVVPEVNVGSVMSFDRVSPHEIFQYAVNNQPAVQSAQAKVMSALYTTKIAKGSLSPTLSVSLGLHDNYYNQSTRPGNISYSLGDSLHSKPIFGNLSSAPTIVGYDRLQYSYTYTPIPLSDQLKNNLSTALSFNLSIPIFSGWQKMTNISNARLQMQIQQLNLENTKNSLKKDIYQSYANAKGSADNYVANLKALESQRQAYDVTKKKYNAGLAASFEMEQSRANLAKSESNVIQAKYNYIFSVKVLDYYQGKKITLN